MSKLIPKSASYMNALHGFAGLPKSHMDGTGINRLSAVLLDPKFGWHFVKAHLEVKQDLPNVAIREEYIKRAYVLCAWKEQCDEVAEAMLFEHPSFVHYRDALQAMLLVRSNTFQDISDRLSISRMTVEAYEQLFFNVRDRMGEELYIASLAYPEGIRVEMTDDYGQRESNQMIMRRMAINYRDNSSLAMLGLPSTRMSDLGADDSATRMEAMIMNNGLQLAKFGMLNQKAVPGIMHARQTIAARKHAGETGNSDDEKFGMASLAKSAGHSILNDIVDMQRTDIQRRTMLQMAWAASSSVSDDDKTKEAEKMVGTKA